MSNLADHEAEQAQITAECEAVECDHPECHEETPARRIKYVCDTCGEDEGSIYWDTTAWWDAEKQAFVASDDINDTAYCGTCGGENCAGVIDADTGAKLKQPPHSHEWLPIAEAQALWDAHHEGYATSYAKRIEERRTTEIAEAMAADRIDDPQTVHLTAYAQLENGDHEYTSDQTQAVGWVTYVRTPTPNDPQQPFDIIREEEHPTAVQAVARAEWLAMEIHGDKTAYNHD